MLTGSGEPFLEWFRVRAQHKIADFAHSRRDCRTRSTQARNQWSELQANRSREAKWVQGVKVNKTAEGARLNRTRGGTSQHARVRGAQAGPGNDFWFFSLCYELKPKPY